ncbi:MAG: signal peptidase I [Lachnospiraceae bacterium]|nr:signal peptidase I [Lachnospiraceae bacterium]
MGRSKGLSFYRKRKKISSGMLREVFGWAFEIFAAAFIAFVLIYFLGVKSSVIGVSMEPELYSSQEVLINRLVYEIFSPKRGDVIVFLPNGNQNSHYYIKRVVGLPGETIQIQDGKLYVNGVYIEEDEAYDKMADAGIAENELTLGAGEYFVLGDNRNNSEDSRSANIGAVSKNTIVGKAWFHMASKHSGMGFVK